MFQMYPAAQQPVVYSEIVRGCIILLYVYLLLCEVCQQGKDIVTTSYHGAQV
jgi:hypothetical protein